MIMNMMLEMFDWKEEIKQLPFQDYGEAMFYDNFTNYT